jgi:hypothetical protein
MLTAPVETEAQIRTSPGSGKPTLLVHIEELVVTFNNEVWFSESLLLLVGNLKDNQLLVCFVGKLVGTLNGVLEGHPLLSLPAIFGGTR